MLFGYHQVLETEHNKKSKPLARYIVYRNQMRLVCRTGDIPPQDAIGPMQPHLRIRFKRPFVSSSFSFFVLFVSEPRNSMDEHEWKISLIRCPCLDSCILHLDSWALCLPEAFWKPFGMNFKKIGYNMAMLIMGVYCYIWTMYGQTKKYLMDLTISQFMIRLWMVGDSWLMAQALWGARPGSQARCPPLPRPPAAPHGPGRAPHEPWAMRREPPSINFRLMN